MISDQFSMSGFNDGGDKESEMPMLPTEEEYLLDTYVAATLKGLLSNPEIAKELGVENMLTSNDSGAHQQIVKMAFVYAMLAMQTREAVLDQLDSGSDQSNNNE